MYRLALHVLNFIVVAFLRLYVFCIHLLQYLFLFSPLATVHYSNLAIVLLMNGQPYQGFVVLRYSRFLQTP